MRKFLFLGLLFFAVLSFVSAADIKGKVVGSDGKPIEGAVVLEPESRMKAETDSEGRFALNVSEAKSLRLVVVHPYYLEEEVRLNVRLLSREVVVTMVPLIRQRDEVVVTATHGVLSDPATERLKNSRISEVIVTDTLPIPSEHRFDKLTVLPIAPMIARAIHEVFKDGSVTSLFEG